jgi:hypothetical protein
MFVNRLPGRIHHHSSQNEDALSVVIQDDAGLAFRRPIETTALTGHADTRGYLSSYPTYQESTAPFLADAILPGLTLVWPIAVVLLLPIIVVEAQYARRPRSLLQLLRR